MQVTGGYLKSRKILSPKGANVRPTLSKTRESVFNVLSNLIDFEGASFLDLFAGSGIMGIEALSRGFKESYFVENDRKTYSLLKENFKSLDLKPDQTKLVFGDSLKAMKKFERKFDVIYADPPYKKGLYNYVVKIIFENELLVEPQDAVNGGILVLEHLEGEEINFSGFKVLKTKKYSDKVITFLSI